MSKSQIMWYFKQLLPLKYETDYGKEGKWYFVKWRMWFGYCFAIDEVELAEPPVEWRTA